MMTNKRAMVLRKYDELPAVLTEVGELPSERRSPGRYRPRLGTGSSIATLLAWQERAVEHGVCKARTILQASYGHHYFLCGSNTTLLNFRHDMHLVDQSGTKPRGTLGLVIDQL